MFQRRGLHFCQINKLLRRRDPGNLRPRDRTFHPGVGLHELYATNGQARRPYFRGPWGLPVEGRQGRRAGYEQALLLAGHVATFNSGQVPMCPCDFVKISPSAETGPSLGRRTLCLSSATPGSRHAKHLPPISLKIAKCRGGSFRAVRDLPQN